MNNFFFRTAPYLLSAVSMAQQVAPQPSARSTAIILSSTGQLKDTNHQALKDLVLEQLGKAITHPKSIDLFPEKSDLFPYATDTTILGSTAEGSIFEQVANTMNTDFKDAAKCKKISLTDKNEIEATRTITALHEIMHYVSFHLRKNNFDLDEYLLRELDNVPPSLSLEAYYQKTIDLFYQEAKNLGLSDLSIPVNAQRTSEKDTDIVAKTLFSSKAYQDAVGASANMSVIHERLADCATALYIFSNYGNTPENTAATKDFLELRRANYQNWDHDTASALEIAKKVFAEHPHKKMTIIESVWHAADGIVKYTPRTLDLNAVFAKIELEEAVTTDDNIASQITALEKAVTEPPSRAETDRIKAEILASRNRVCAIEPPPPAIQQRKLTLTGLAAH